MKLPFSPAAPPVTLMSYCCASPCCEVAPYADSSTPFTRRRVMMLTTPPMASEP